MPRNTTTVWAIQGPGTCLDLGAGWDTPNLMLTYRPTSLSAATAAATIIIKMTCITIISPHPASTRMQGWLNCTNTSKWITACVYLLSACSLGMFLSCTLVNIYTSWCLSASHVHFFISCFSYVFKINCKDNWIKRVKRQLYFCHNIVKCWPFYNSFTSRLESNYLLILVKWSLMISMHLIV